MKTGFLAVVLTIVFVVLQLASTIAWSWWWVFSPLWIYGILVILAVIAGVIFANKIADWQVRRIERFIDALTGPPRK